MGEISVIAVLADPVRRRLYDYIAGQPDGISRGEAAQAVGIQRTLAAFHLDRLAEAGLVDVTFRRAGRGQGQDGRPSSTGARRPSIRSACRPGITAAPPNCWLTSST
jgi:DNA-binding transcriptional ArsR family regulator